jgi:hypothetical protein
VTKLITAAPQEMLSGQETGISPNFYSFYNKATTLFGQLATRHVMTRVNNMKG